MTKGSLGQCDKTKQLARVSEVDEPEDAKVEEKLTIKSQVSNNNNGVYTCLIKI